MRAFRILLFTLLGTGVMSGLLLGVSGQWDEPILWAYVGIWTGAILAAFTIVKPDLLRERMRPGSGAQQDLLRWLWMPLLGLHWLSAGLDAGRLHWTDLVPLPVRLAGLVVMTVALVFGLAAVAVNPFFSSVIRIQQDRGQYVVTTGPYRLVRHPAYAAIIGFTIGSTLALNSCLSGIPNLIWIVLVIRRATVEDPVLLQSLPGYLDYAKRVRYRLVPGVW